MERHGVAPRLELPIVETIETHMSWVFLTAGRAYKLKKPIALPYLDHRSVERRRRSCMKELALGRRLAPSVYLDVVPLVPSGGGLALDRGVDRGAGPDRGEIVDWLVEMRRLPATAMLPYAVEAGTATAADAEAVGDVLAAFYRKAERARWTAPEYRRRMRDLVAPYAAELAAYGVPREQLARIGGALFALIEQHAEPLDRRVAEGRVVDAHGDLRPEHVCLESPPAVIDPLELDDDLRTLDAGSELAFFTMECDRLGARWFADRVVARYAERTGDRAPAPIAALYVGQHALARALIALRHLPDVPPAEHAKWRARADDYLARARAACDAA
jgi:aminoglycoside phosphotransferase family enzyme